MRILSQNSKMRKSQNDTWDIYNFGIPAFLSQSGIKTCPNAGQCATGCYARNGTYRFGNVVNAYEERLKLTQSPDFVKTMVNEIKSKFYASQAKGKQCLIRIHDSGDFYSRVYLTDWILIMEQCPEVQFYAYTKMIQMFEDCKAVFPNNFTYIYSYGGKQDSQIDTTNHRHSKVFQSETELVKAGYIDASNNDLIAAIGPSNKIGLVYHGQRKFVNTGWTKVS